MLLLLRAPFTWASRFGAMDIAVVSRQLVMSTAAGARFVDMVSGLPSAGSRPCLPMGVGEVRLKSHLLPPLGGPGGGQTHSAEGSRSRASERLHWALV